MDIKELTDSIIRQRPGKILVTDDNELTLDLMVDAIGNGRYEVFPV